MPDWFNQTFFRDLNHLAALGSINTFSSFDPKFKDNMHRMNGGGFLKKVVENFETSDTKVVAYSAHDTSIESTLQALGQFNEFRAPYASCLMFELYEDDSVELWFRNGTNSLVELSLCEESTCDFEKMKKKISKVMPIVDIDTECGLVESDADWPLFLLCITWGIITAFYTTRFIVGILNSRRLQARLYKVWN